MRRRVATKIALTIAGATGGGPLPSTPPSGGVDVPEHGAPVLQLPWREKPHALSWLPIGNCRMRLPVAAKIALAIAGATGGSPGSPTPPSGCV